MQLKLKECDCTPETLQQIELSSMTIFDLDLDPPNHDHADDNQTQTTTTTAIPVVPTKTSKPPSATDEKKINPSVKRPTAKRSSSLTNKPSKPAAISRQSPKVPPPLSALKKPSSSIKKPTSTQKGPVTRPPILSRSKLLAPNSARLQAQSESEDSVSSHVSSEVVSSTVVSSPPRTLPVPVFSFSGNHQVVNNNNNNNNNNNIMIMQSIMQNKNNLMMENNNNHNNNNNNNSSMIVHDKNNNDNRATDNNGIEDNGSSSVEGGMLFSGSGSSIGTELIQATADSFKRVDFIMPSARLPPPRNLPLFPPPTHARKSLFFQQLPPPPSHCTVPSTTTGMSSSSPNVLNNGTRQVMYNSGNVLPVRSPAPHCIPGGPGFNSHPMQPFYFDDFQSRDYEAVYYSTTANHLHHHHQSPSLAPTLQPQDSSKNILSPLPHPTINMESASSSLMRAAKQARQEEDDSISAASSVASSHKEQPRQNRRNAEVVRLSIRLPSSTFNNNNNNNNNMQNNNMHDNNNNNNNNNSCLVRSSKADLCGLFGSFLSGENGEGACYIMVIGGSVVLEDIRMGILGGEARILQVDDDMFIGGIDVGIVSDIVDAIGVSLGYETVLIYGDDCLLDRLGIVYNKDSSRIKLYC